MRARWGMAFLAVWMSGRLWAAGVEATVETEKSTVALGDDIVLVITATNRGDETVRVPTIQLERGVLEFKALMGVDKDRGASLAAFTYTRIRGGPARNPADPGVTQELAPGRSMKAVVKIVAAMPGKATFVGLLWGSVQLPAMTVDVTGKDRELRFVLDTDQGTMEARLLPEYAPNTVMNMARLAKDGFFNGLKFHRIIKNFMVQGGDPAGDGSGGPGFTLPAEFNGVHHARGVLSMARSGHPDSAGSQFFVMHGDAPNLDGQYTAWGVLAAGTEVLDKIANLPVKEKDLGGQKEMSDPVTPPVIKNATVRAVGSEAAK